MTTDAFNNICDFIYSYLGIRIDTFYFFFLQALRAVAVLASLGGAVKLN